MKGWYGDKLRHGLASKGIKTGIDTNGDYSLYEFNQKSPIISAHLEVEQIVYVPSTDVEDEIISEEELRERVDEVRGILSALFGGYTSVQGYGGYTGNGELIEEPVIRVISYATKDDFENKNMVLMEFLEMKRQEWKQDTIGYEVEGDLYYLGETRWGASGSINEEFKKAWKKEKREKEELREDIAKILSFKDL